MTPFVTRSSDHARPGDLIHTGKGFIRIHAASVAPATAHRAQVEDASLRVTGSPQ